MKVDLPAEIVFGLAGCGLRRSPGFGVAKDEAFPLGHPLAEQRAAVARSDALRALQSRGGDGVTPSSRARSLRLKECGASVAMDCEPMSRAR